MSLRLLAIIEAYSITGPAKNLLGFAKLARAAGVETTIATFTRGASTNLFIDTAIEGGLKVEVIHESGLYDRRVIRNLSQLAERLRPDLIQTHAVKSHFLACCASLPSKAPWVAFHHGYTWPTLRARLYNQIDRWSLRTARKVLTVSLPFREELIARGVSPDRIEIVHNAIPPDWGSRFRDPAHAHTLRTKLGIGEDRNVILIVGRLSREKDHLTLLEAVARLPSALLPHVVIVGEGPERTRIGECIRRLKLNSSVTLTGQQESVEPYYGIAQVAVLSSLSEGSPNALLEAMAAGVPVVATRVGGIPEIVTDRESALLIEPADIAAMKDSLAALLQNTALASSLVEHAQQRILKYHSPEARTAKLVDIYTRLSRTA
ncbi:MAG TPA: glycosyltransferase family 4 protein [Terracidiphilus sp.]|nr:glycosyltransferase family 4 protein [Terracidiphilus sp.]